MKIRDVSIRSIVPPAECTPHWCQISRLCSDLAGIEKSRAKMPGLEVLNLNVPDLSGVLRKSLISLTEY